MFLAHRRSRNASAQVRTVLALMLAITAIACVPPTSAFTVSPASVFINEIHYDNDGTDAGEAIEIAGPAGTDLTGWSIVLYNGSGGAVYDTDALGGVIPNQQNGYGTVALTYPSNGIQNGSPDGIALVNGTTVMQFLSYEGTFTAVGGPADGLASTDIGVSEGGSTPLGFSLQLSGSGTTYQDFTWQPPAQNTFGAVNTGQTFAGASTPTLSLSVAPSSFSEAAGTNAATGTVTRSGSTAAALTVSLSSSDTSEATVPASVLILAGQASATFQVDAVDDAIADGSQVVTLSAEATGFTGGSASVTVTDDDLRIHDIQGAAHISPLVGQLVSNVAGIVTAKSSNGFYMQDPQPDTDPATSEGLFVFLGTNAPQLSTINVGDAVLVNGTVVEFRPGGSGGTDNLTLTEISNPGRSVTVQSSGNALPAPTVIGLGGRTPPTVIIENDTNGSVEDASDNDFDPAQDGIDFYESLEAMLVQVNDALAVGPTSDFGEIPVVADNGANAGPRSARGGVIIGDDYSDFNPERIIIDDTIVSNPPALKVNDRFGSPVIGVLDYSFGNFKLYNTQPWPSVIDGGLTREVTSLTSNGNQLTVASFNVENLSPNNSADKFNELASLIVNNLKSPDIIGIEEVQDNNGATNDAVVDADQTLNLLIAAIQRAGGPAYEYRQINPVDDQDGGQPGGNIRVAFLFKPGRVKFVDRPGGTPTASTTVVAGKKGPELSFSPGRIAPTDPAFEDSRKPLAGEFVVNGRTFFVIVNHFNSKGGDDPLFGRFQPPERSSEDQRIAQAQIVNDFVDSILALDPNANVVVLGDLNDFEFSPTIETLKGEVLNDLVELLPKPERYTYVFDGNSQVLDHILISDYLFARGVPEYDVVHVNAEFPDQASDHDPEVARFTLDRVQPQSAPGGNAWLPVVTAER